ncbi:MAG TPA: CDP-alcohol phosphatidyltransferase family protein [Allosphingosinicella sp.]|nr:CDP-alcohol phosphatidyltransferase family protein [Allosphingosinicella sp.]
MDPTDSPQQPGPPAMMAWLVHLATAFGAVLAFLALAAIGREDWTAALLWLAAALAIDSVDGSLARWARVKARAPRIDGETLDLIIDYLNYVFVPTMLIVEAGLVPAALAPFLAALILVSALYNFTRADLKTEDNYFRGFPALWNVVAFYLFVARPGAEAGAILVCVFSALTFAPVHFVHPFRVRGYGPWLALLALGWAGATAALLWPGWGPPVRTAWLACSSGAGVLLVALGLLRTLRGARPAPPPD